MSWTSPRYVAALAVFAMAAAIVSQPAEAAKADKLGEVKKELMKKGAKEVPHAKEIEHLATAAEVVEKEEAAVQKALAKAEAEAAKKAGDDAGQRDRLVAVACRKAVAGLEACGAKYGRVLMAAQPIAKKPDLKDESKTKLQTLAAKLSMLRRSNVERTADLYEKMGKDRKSLGLLEALYRSIPEQQRFSAMSLKDRIDALKAKVNPKRKAGGAK
jgi:hypothetical protein